MIPVDMIAGLLNLLNLLKAGTLQINCTFATLTIVAEFSSYPEATWDKADPGIVEAMNRGLLSELRMLERRGHILSNPHYKLTVNSAENEQSCKVEIEVYLQ